MSVELGVLCIIQKKIKKKTEIDLVNRIKTTIHQSNVYNIITENIQNKQTLR